MNARRQRVAVTGLGIASALGGSAQETFERLLAGEQSIGAVQRFETTGLRSRIAAEVHATRLPSGLDPESLSRTDAMAIAAAREALASSGLRVKSGALGAVLGGTAGAMLETEEDLLRHGADAKSAARAARFLSNPLSSTIVALERVLGTLGAATTVCSACSSGNAALTIGAHWVASSRFGAVLAGGADGLCRMTFAGFNALGALDPAPCRPFDVSRRGLTLGEGAAFLLLESEESATARGAKILAWLSGWALGAEAHHSTHPEPTGERAGLLMRVAMQEAGLSPEDIDYVNAHGTGTLHNDAMEALAFHVAFGAEASRVKVSSSKAQVGHTLGAAGALEAAITVMALGSGETPPTIGLTEAADTGLRHVRTVEPGHLRAALSNSFGFGGLDAVLAFRSSGEPARSTGELHTELVVTALGRPDFEGLGSLDAERSRRFDRLTVGATTAAAAALSAAELAPAGVGLVMANAYGNVERSLRFLDRLLFQGPKHAPPAEFPHLLHSAPAGNASIYLGLTGPVFTVSDGALGAESALTSAISLLEFGVATAVLAGGIEPEDPIVRELSPTCAGLPRGEGGGFLLVERADVARERGRRPLARLLSHQEERGHARRLVLEAPLDVAHARVVLPTADAPLEARLLGTPWANARVSIAARDDTGGHEALGMLAFDHAISVIQQGIAREVLVVSGGVARRYFTRFTAAEAGA